MRPLVVPGLGLLLVLACTGSGAPPPAPGASIQSFTADPPALFVGEAVLLTAVFSGGAGTIDPDIGPVESGVPVTLKPGTTPTTYVLRVGDGARAVTAELPLAVAYRDRLDAVARGLPRTDHAAALLEDGRVLLAAGLSGTGFESRTELWNPATDEFAPAGELDLPHSEAAVVVDAKRVLVTGGLDASTASPTALVHGFDQASGAWTRLHDMFEMRHLHTATLLPSGGILLAGGQFARRPPSAVRSVEIYSGGDPSRAPAGGGMVFPRFGHTATPLPDGTILVAGGQDAFTNVLVPAAEIFDPATETFTPVSSLVVPRTLHVAAPLPGGRVLLAGGDTDGTPSTTSAEIYDAATRTFSPAGPLRYGRTFHAAVALASGEVLVAGGMDADGALSDVVEIFRPAAGAFAASAARMASGRFGLALVRLPDDRVLVHGGRTAAGAPDGLAWVYR